MPENQERFVPTDDHGWPLLDDVVLTPSGWRPRTRLERHNDNATVTITPPSDADLVLPRPLLPPNELPTLTQTVLTPTDRPLQRPPSLPPVELPVITQRTAVTPPPPPQTLRRLEPPAPHASAEPVRFSDVAPAPDSDWYRDLSSDDAAITPDAEPELPEGYVFPKRRRRWKFRPFALFVVAGLVAIGGLLWQRSRQVGVAVGALRPGYCLVLPAPEVTGDAALDRFERVRCDLAHNAEVFATKVFDTSAPFAGGDGLSRVAGATCESSVPPVIRSHPDASTWSIQFFAPTTAETYQQGKRATLLCVVRFPVNRTLPLIG